MSLYPDDRTIQIGSTQVKYPGLVDGKFSDGDPADPTKPASFLPATHINLLTDLLEQIITLAGKEPSAVAPNQMRDALVLLLKNAREQAEDNARKDVDKRIASALTDGESQIATIGVVKKLKPKQGLSLEDVRDEIDTAIAKEKREIQNETLRQAIPVGFIYIQLPFMSTPESIYPRAWKWENVSNQFAGCFFRVEGKSASEFQSGQQLDAMRNITGSFGKLCADRHRDMSYSGAFEKLWSGNIGTDGGSGSDFGVKIDFDASRCGVPTAEEIRPVNYTVRVWKRIR